MSSLAGKIQVLNKMELCQRNVRSFLRLCMMSFSRNQFSKKFGRDKGLEIEITA